MQTRNRFIMFANKKMESMKKYSTSDFKAYQFYREKSKYCNRELVKDFVDYGNILGEFYDVVRDSLVESKSGVHLDNFCYLGVLINPYVPIYKKAFYDKGYQPKPSYNLVYVSTARHNIFKTVVMDKSFFTKAKKQLSENLKKGYEYFFSPSLFFKNRK